MPFIAPIVEAVVAIGAAVSSFVAGVGIIGQAVIMAGIGVASTYLISALTPKPQTDGSSSPGGVNFQRQYGANVSRQVPCGLVGLAGHDVYVSTSGTANNLLQQVYVLGDYLCEALNRIAINGVYCNLGDDAGDGYRPVVDGGNFAQNPPLIYVKFCDGSQATADANLVNFANPAERWASTNIGVGLCYVIIQMFYDTNNNSSFPDFFFELRGARIYDFRLDDTVGGSGDHRFGDLTTYQYSANPIIIEYNYRRGFTINGDLFCGMGMSASDLPLDKWTTAANICDELQGDGLPRYMCSILLDCMTTHSDNLQSISLSCGSMQIDAVDGSWPLVGTDQTVVRTFLDSDIISLADFKYTAKQSMSTLVNSVSGNYPEPDQFWSMISYDGQTNSDLLTIDRRTRDLSMDFPQVPLKRQADQLAFIYLYENRFEITSTVTLRPRFQTLEAGDWVNWNSKRYGLHTFIVTGTQLLNLDSADGPRNIVLSLQQRDGSMYDGVTPTISVLPFPPGQPNYMAEVADFALIPVSVAGVNGVVQAAIRVSWAAITDVTVTSVAVMYYPVGHPEAAIVQTVTSDISVVVLAEGIVGVTLYAVQAKIITTPLRTTTYNAGLTVTTLQNIYTLANFDDALQYQVTTALANLSDRLSNAEQLIASVSSNASGRQWNNKQMVQRQLQSVTGTLGASITETLTVATNTQTAFAAYQLDVNATLGTQSADITENATAIADVVTGFTASWSLTLNVAGHIDGIKLLSDGTTGAFIIDTDVFQIANPAAFGGAAQTVFTLQLVDGVEQMALRGDFVADGTIKAQALDVATLSAISANLGTINTGLIETTSGLTTIDLVNERMIFSEP